MCRISTRLERRPEGGEGTTWPETFVSNCDCQTPLVTPAKEAIIQLMIIASSLQITPSRRGPGPIPTSVALPEEAWSQKTLKIGYLRNDGSRPTRLSGNWLHRGCACF